VRDRIVADTLVLPLALLRGAAAIGMPYRHPLHGLGRYEEAFERGQRERVNTKTAYVVAATVLWASWVGSRPAQFLPRPVGSCSLGR